MEQYDGGVAATDMSTASQAGKYSASNYRNFTNVTALGTMNPVDSITHNTNWLNNHLSSLAADFGSCV